MPQPRWLDFAWADLGVAEVPGAAGDPRIARYYADAGHSSIAGDDVAWCAAFLGACLTAVWWIFRTGWRLKS